MEVAMTDKGSTHQYAFKILPEQRLIIEVHAGLTNLEAAISIKKEEVQHELFSSEYNILSDVRALRFNLKSRDAHGLFEYVSGQPDITSNQRKVAFLTSESDQVAITTVYKMLHKKDHGRYRVFSTLEYALIWLHLDWTEEELTCELEAMGEGLNP